MCKVLYKEKLVGDFTPFKMVQEVPRIEKYLQEYTATTTLFSAAGGVLRSESLYKADLYDLFIFIHTEQNEEIDTYCIIVMRVGEGVTNANSNASQRSTVVCFMCPGILSTPSCSCYTGEFRNKFI